MKSTDKIIMLALFFFGFLAFWLLTGYQAEWDADRLQRMAVIRVGFSTVVGCMCCVGYCLYKLIEHE